MTNDQVVIAGGGPTGLMLAGELALADVDVVIVERRPNQDLDGSRSRGLHARTIEVLDQRGIVERFLEAGQEHPSVGYSQIVLDISDFPTRHNYVLALMQHEFEPLLADWVLELGVPILRNREVVGFTQDDTGVDVELSDGTSLRAAYLVGCDGGRSVIRKTAAIDFPGLDPSTSWMIAEVQVDGVPELGFKHDETGTHAIGPAADGTSFGIVLTERSIDHDGDPDIDDLRAALVGVYGTDFGLRSTSWISRFTDMSRQASTYRKGRVLLAGDAAHVHPPQGGQGLNTGVQDAVNLGWKLAQVVSGTSPESLLDTYHAERHPVGARVQHNTRAQIALGRPDERHQALRETMTELLGMDEPRRRIVGMLSGLDIKYDLGDGHPLLGRRIPDLDITTEDGPRRVYSLLHDARPVLLTFGDVAASLDGVRVPDRLRAVHADPVDDWELPVVGSVQPPDAVLIRPDGYVAWVGVTSDARLDEAITRWFRPATRSQ
jgi:2-polyprenyl-6-methoxyphenol hydroxylase-like FAD-dependent oxidoreductase